MLKPNDKEIESRQCLWKITNKKDNHKGLGIYYLLLKRERNMKTNDKPFFHKDQLRWILYRPHRCLESLFFKGRGVQESLRKVSSSATQGPSPEEPFKYKYH